MRYPPIEPFASGMLEVDEHDRIFWEISGNPDGKPVVAVHGGPGSGLSVHRRRLFDPERYRIIQFDQRGCGRSTPHAADPTTSLAANTTPQLIADLERLRAYLDVEQWQLFGTSWGSTLSLAYAITHPERVTEIVEVAVTTGRHSEVDWLYYGVRTFFPEAWQEFHDYLPDALRSHGLLGGYSRLMDDPDEQVRRDAAAAWCRWEDAVLSTETLTSPTPYGDRPGDDQLAMVRICAHYFSHGLFLPDNLIFDRVDRLSGIPGVLIHGRGDIGGPVSNAWELSRRWTDSELIIVPGTGHMGSDAMDVATLAATDRFALR